MKTNRLSRYGLLSLMLLMLGLSWGCAKDQGAVAQTADPYSDSGAVFTTEERMAADNISNATIYFAYDRYDITAESKQVLASDAEILKKYPLLRVVIEGHCDERGTDEYNLALGERRAQAAYDYLVLMGVSPNQLDTVSMGKMHPAVEGHSEAAWKKNRRCEFKVGKMKK